MKQNKIISIMRKIILNYDVKHNKDEFKPAYICKNFDTRNRYKVDEYKIPEDQPQCPIFQDNRCCGCCKLAKTCDHCVDCGCYGYTTATLGGIENEMTHKASRYYKNGCLDDNGEFDWNTYKIKEVLDNKDLYRIGNYCVININNKNCLAEIKSKPNKVNNIIKLYLIDENKHIKGNIKDIIKYSISKNKEDCKWYY